MRSVVRLCNLFFGETASLSAQVLGNAAPLGGGVAVTTVGLKGQPQDTFLELGNGQKFLSRGPVPEVPIVTTGLIVRVCLTITSLLHEVDLVLGVNWLQLVNPVVDWRGGKVYLPHAVHTALLQGD